MSPGSQDAAACPGEDGASTFGGHASASHAGANAGAGEAASGRGTGGLWTVPYTMIRYDKRFFKRITYQISVKS